MAESKTDKSQDVTIAVLANDVAYVKKAVDKISTTLEILEKNYVKRTEVELLLKDADQIHKDLAQSIKAIELDVAVSKTQVKTWGAAAVLALGILQFVISIFIK